MIRTQWIASSSLHATVECKWISIRLISWRLNQRKSELEYYDEHTCATHSKVNIWPIFGCSRNASSASVDWVSLNAIVGDHIWYMKRPCRVVHAKSSACSTLLYTRHDSCLITMRSVIRIDTLGCFSIVDVMYWQEMSIELAENNQLQRVSPPGVSLHHWLEEIGVTFQITVDNSWTSGNACNHAVKCCDAKKGYKLSEVVDDN